MNHSYTKEVYQGFLINEIYNDHTHIYYRVVMADGSYDHNPYIFATIEECKLFINNLYKIIMTDQVQPKQKAKPRYVCSICKKQRVTIHVGYNKVSKAEDIHIECLNCKHKQQITQPLN